MDRSGRILRGAGGLAAWVLVACAGANAPQHLDEQSGAQQRPAALQLRQLAWISEDVDPIAALSTQPRSCVHWPADPKESARVRQGELAFANPALLGGQAAKIGLSCASCHENGRGNPDFFIAAVSDAAGRADVSSGVFSRARADNVFNPLDIPDLARPEGQDLVDRSDRAALTAFTLDQIMQEFSGPTPPGLVLDGLISYLQAIEAESCDLDAAEPVSWQSDWQDAREAYEIGLAYEAAGEGDAGAFYISHARESLRVLYERYQTVSDPSIQQALLQLSRDMAARTVDKVAFERVVSELRAKQAQSAYNPQTLRDHLKGE